jgi:hypothetical protein
MPTERGSVVVVESVSHGYYADIRHAVAAFDSEERARKWARDEITGDYHVTEVAHYEY